MTLTSDFLFITALPAASIGLTENTIISDGL